MLYAMLVDETISFDNYWNDVRFGFKRPLLNGSLIQTLGDNIYHKGEDGAYVQEPSHHSHEDGSTNPLTLNQDTGNCDKVLIAEQFYYFGDQAVEIPRRWLDRMVIRRSRKCMRGDDAKSFIDWLKANFRPGIWGEPYGWQGEMPKWGV